MTERPPLPAPLPADPRPATTGAVRWHIVTGKGGVGKTTLAAALAIALAQGGRRVLLAEIEQRQGIATALAAAPLSYTETVLDSTENGGTVLGMALDPETALLDYLQTFYRLGRAGRALRRFGAIDFATTIAPGIADVLLIGKITEAVLSRSAPDDYRYDAVVLDAPPTGRVGKVLGAAGEVGELAALGPIRRHAELVTTLLQSPAAAVHIVTTPEELPVTEAEEVVEELRLAGMHPGCIMLNRMAVPAVPTGRLTIAELTTTLRDADAPHDRRTVGAVLRGLQDHRRRRTQQRGYERRLARLGLPQQQFPELIGALGFTGIRQLADSVALESITTPVPP